MELPLDVDLIDRDVGLPYGEGTGGSDHLERIEGPVQGSRVGMIVPLLLVTVFGACLRLPGLSIQSLWQDEAFSWRMSRFSWPEIIHLTAGDVHPPLYYLALHAWTSVLGDSVGAMRSLSAICGVIDICIIYLFVGDLLKLRDRPQSGGRWGIATLAGLLAASSPFLIAHDRDARMYALGCLLATASSWALWRILQCPGVSMRAWFAYVLLAVGLVYTHNFGLFTVAAQAVFASIVLVSDILQGRTTRSRWHRLLATTMAFATIALAYAPWVPALLDQDRHVVGTFWTSPLNVETMIGSIDQLFTGFIDLNYPLTDGASVLFVVGVLVALLVGRRAGDFYLVLLIATPFVLGITVSLLQRRNIVIGRCLAFTVPFLAIGVARLAGRVPPGIARRAIIAALILDVGVTQWLSWGTSRSADCPGLRAAVDEILRGYRDGDEVFSFDRGGEHLAMCYYAKGRFKPVILFREGQRPKHYHGSVLLADDELLDASLAVRTCTSRVWLLLTAANRSRLLFRDSGEWKMVASKTFAESAPYRGGEVFLDIWERKPGLDGNERRPATQLLSGPVVP
jgi:mannosyltransferase